MSEIDDLIFAILGLGRAFFGHFLPSSCQSKYRVFRALSDSARRAESHGIRSGIPWYPYGFAAIIVVAANMNGLGGKENGGREGAGICDAAADPANSIPRVESPIEWNDRVAQLVLHQHRDQLRDPPNDEANN